ncbi:MAG: indole-3-glycerol-phosphate synthase TrpC, partial [Lachnospiraceae bacterium]|nr:indole-3-glycerol-phosphate synthase TrpC [Lachnospiraceae bacterium]
MILDEIAQKTRERINLEKQKLPLTELRRMAEELPVSGEYPFYKAIKKQGMSFICEVKKASPSK